jgi:hypothetical protein
MRKISAISVVALLAGALIAPGHEALARGGGGGSGRGGGFGGGGFHGGGFRGWFPRRCLRKEFWRPHGIDRLVEVGR